MASPLAVRLICGHKVDDKGKDLDEQGVIDKDFLSSVEHVILDQAEAFHFQNLEHLEEVLKALNQRPKKLTQLNDISRIAEIFTLEPKDKVHSTVIPFIRQTVTISKFLTLDLDFLLQSHRFNRTGAIDVLNLEPNRA